MNLQSLKHSTETFFQKLGKTYMQDFLQDTYGRITLDMHVMHLMDNADV